MGRMCGVRDGEAEFMNRVCRDCGSKGDIVESKFYRVAPTKPMYHLNAIEHYEGAKLAGYFLCDKCKNKLEKDEE